MTLALAVTALVLALLTDAFLIAVAVLIHRTIDKHRHLLQMFGAFGAEPSGEALGGDLAVTAEAEAPAALPDPGEPAPAPQTDNQPEPWEGR